MDLLERGGFLRIARCYLGRRLRQYIRCMELLERGGFRRIARCYLGSRLRQYIRCLLFVGTYRMPQLRQVTPVKVAVNAPAPVPPIKPCLKNKCSKNIESRTASEHPIARKANTSPVCDELPSRGFRWNGGQTKRNVSLEISPRDRSADTSLGVFFALFLTKISFEIYPRWQVCYLSFRSVRYVPGMRQYK